MVDLPSDRDPAELVPWFDRLALVRRQPGTSWKLRDLRDCLARIACV